MKADFVVQQPAPAPIQSETFADTIQRIVTEQTWTRLSVAVAYSSVAGVTWLHELVSNSNGNICFRWLLGVDDYFTQPGSIEFCTSRSKSSVKVYKSTQQAVRFHPKFYLFENSSQSSNAVLIVGSANLTASATKKNCEAYAIIRTNKKAKIKQLVRLYDGLWQEGINPSDRFMEKYKRNFRRQNRVKSYANIGETKKEARAKPHTILENDEAEMSPDKAKFYWIELGKNTAMGRELEFKAEQARYFGLSPRGGAPERKSFLVSSGTSAKLRLKYQANKMWRLQFTRDVPEFVAGLRPTDRDGRLGRSPYAAVFRRISGNDEFRLSFVRTNSDKYHRIRSRSKSIGALGRTTAREYGWY